MIRSRSPNVKLRLCLAACRSGDVRRSVEEGYLRSKGWVAVTSIDLGYFAVIHARRVSTVAAPRLAANEVLMRASYNLVKRGEILFSMKCAAS